MKIPCNCKSDERALVILARNFSSDYPELISLAGDEDVRYHPEVGALQMGVGSGHKWSGVAEVANFFRAVLDPQRFAALRATWVTGDAPLAGQLHNLVHAEPLASLSQVDSSPIMEILNSRRIETWFQPIIEARTEEVWGYECLMRGRTAAGDLVSAPRMIEWARQEQLTFMLDRVCREIHLENAGRAGAPPGCYFSINFLPTAIYQPNFCLSTSMAAARRSGLRPEQIIFEVVETEKVNDQDHLRKILDHYRGAGFRIALDDLGSGYAGLSLLGDLRPDLIKIDRDLVNKAVGSDFHRGICSLLVKLGQENGHLVLAEGVETAAEKSVMDHLGVDLYQGYFFGRPSPTLVNMTPLVEVAPHVGAREVAQTTTPLFN